MDYERKIKQIEEETRHENAMRLLQAEHLDAHDTSIAAIQKILERTEKNIETLTADVISLTASQTATQQMLKDLIAAMAREHTNGKH
jgi:hypothetical protein